MSRRRWREGAGRGGGRQAERVVSEELREGEEEKMGEVGVPGGKEAEGLALRPRHGGVLLPPPWLGLQAGRAGTQLWGPWRGSAGT